MKKFINKNLKTILKEFITNDFAGLLWIFTAILLKSENLKVLYIIICLVLLVAIIQIVINIVLFFVNLIIHKKPFREMNTEAVRYYLSMVLVLLMTKFVFNKGIISNIFFILFLIHGILEFIRFLLCIIDEILDAVNESLDDFQEQSFENEEE